MPQERAQKENLMKEELKLKYQRSKEYDADLLLSDQSKKKEDSECVIIEDDKHSHTSADTSSCDDSDTNLELPIFYSF